VRPLTSAQTQSLGSAYRTVRYRVCVDATGSLDYVDLSNLGHYDWLQDVTIDEQIDQPVSTCTVRLARSVYRLSINPLMGASKFNNGQALLAPGRRMFVESLTTLPDAPNVAAQYVRIFEGYIDDVDPGGEVIELSCRDLGALLTDTYIEVERNYGTAMGTPVSVVMQEILDNNINGPGLGAVTLVVPSVPSFLLLTYQQNKMTVFDALTALADQIAWTVRYRWSASDNAFVLMLYEPDREKTTPDYTFDVNDYTDISGLRLSRKDIRNVVQVVFDDQTSSNVLRQKVQVQNLASIAANGRRFMELSEASTSQINTLEEAQRMAQGALADLSAPAADHVVSLDYFFAAQLGDLYAFLPNGHHYDTLQKFAVVGVRHELSADNRCVTTLTTRGKPAASYKRWLRLEGRPGVGPNAGYRDPATPAAISCVASLGSIIIDVVPDDFSRWSRTEIYLDTQAVPLPVNPTINDKNVALPEALRVAQGKQTKFVIDGLIPGQAYFGRVQIIDTDGNRSAPSVQFSIATERVGPYHTNSDTTNGILNANSDFNAYTKGYGTWPDAWKGYGDTAWGAASGQPVVFYSEADAASGRSCIILYAGTYVTPISGGGLVYGGIQTSKEAIFPFAGGDILQVAAWVKWSETLPAGVTALQAVVTYQFYNASKVALTPLNSDISFFQQFGTIHSSEGAQFIGWHEAFADVTTVPNATRYVGIAVRRWGRIEGGEFTQTGAPWGLGTAMPGLYLDRITVMRGTPTIISNLASLSGNQYFEPNEDLRITTYDAGADALYPGFYQPIDSDSSEWTAKIACTAIITASFTVISLNIDQTVFEVWIDVWHRADAAWTEVTSSTFRLAQSETQRVSLTASAVELAAGDKFRLMLRNTHEANVPYSSVRLKCMTTRRDK
jgi:hypothetical protein